MIAGHLTGLVFFLGILAAYLTLGRRWIDLSLMLGKIEQLGLDRWWLYTAFGLYACFVNSLLEEYFWRWFIFRRLQDVPGRRHLPLAVVAAGLLFTAHHVIALSVYFDWRITAPRLDGRLHRRRHVVRALPPLPQHLRRLDQPYLGRPRHLRHRRVAHLRVVDRPHRHFCSGQLRHADVEAAGVSASSISPRNAAVAATM